MAKFVQLYAYYANNLGDDLMVYCLLKTFPDVTFFCNQYIPENKTILQQKNFLAKTIYRRSTKVKNILNRAINKKKECLLYLICKYCLNKIDCSVYIGGSIFDPNQWENIEKRIKREMQCLEGFPLFVIGANFCESDDKKYVAAFRSYFQSCKGVSFRDSFSHKIFADLPNIQHTADVVFNISTDRFDIKEEGTVIISVIDLAQDFRGDKTEYVESYDDFIRKICEECVLMGKTPILFSFCKREGDENAILRIMSTMEDNIKMSTKTYFYNGDIFEALEVFSKTDYVIASRFHAMILALRFGKPFFSIAYNKKTTNVLHDLECDAYCELNEIKNISAKEVFEFSGIGIDIGAYMRSAEKQFSQFSSYIYK